MNLAAFEKELQKEKINAVIISEHGKPILEYYKNKKQKDKLHKMNSITKSIVSILVGIALEKGYLQTLDEPLHKFFPSILNQQSDKRKMDLTIRHLITMTDGLDFPEFGEWNSFAPMVYYRDIVKFVLDRPLVHEIGTHMNYNSGCSHILSAILQQVTGMKTEEFAVNYLFNPLDINEYRWYLDKLNINKGADGLVLKISDMQKIGQLMLEKGIYKQNRIVSKAWVEQTTRPNKITYKGIGYYGMHWWVNNQTKDDNFTEENTYYFALGFGGQYIVVYPNKNLVITVTSDMYDNSLKPMQIMEKYILL